MGRALAQAVLTALARLPSNPLLTQAVSARSGLRLACD